MHRRRSGRVRGGLYDTFMDEPGPAATVVDLAWWRRTRHARRETSPGHKDAPASPPDAPGADQEDVRRLERAVDRVHTLVTRALDARGHLEPRVETELLAIMGELTVGLVAEAAGRAERLAERLAARKGGVG